MEILKKVSIENGKEKELGKILEVEKNFVNVLGKCRKKLRNFRKCKNLENVNIKKMLRKRGGFKNWSKKKNLKNFGLACGNSEKLQRNFGNISVKNL